MSPNFLQAFQVISRFSTTLMRMFILKNRSQCPGMVVHQEDPCKLEASLDYLASVRQAYITQQDPASRGCEREGKERRKKTGWRDILVFILCVWMFCMFVYMYPLYMHGNLGRLEEELELQMVESCHLDARNWTPVLYKSRKCLDYSAILSSPKQPWKLKRHRVSHFRIVKTEVTSQRKQDIPEYASLCLKLHPQRETGWIFVHRYMEA